jgi:hypothetical protein
MPTLISLIILSAAPLFTYEIVFRQHLGWQRTWTFQASMTSSTVNGPFPPIPLCDWENILVFQRNFG